MILLLAICYRITSINIKKLYKLDERKFQYSRSNILGFINRGYFTSDNVPDGIKMQPTIHFQISEKSWLLKLKYPAFFGNG
jgi:hypothetical protein